jgi:hypothetical protein
MLSSKPPNLLSDRCNWAIELHNDDVISMASGDSITSSPTFLVEEFLQKWKSKFIGNGGHRQTEYFYFLDEGIACKTLSADGGSGWKKGRIRFRLEFIPDEIYEVDVQDAEAAQNLLSPSPLDDLREKLNVE